MPNHTSSTFDYPTMGEWTVEVCPFESDDLAASHPGGRRGAMIDVTPSHEPHQSVPFADVESAV